ncbi:uncharacterized protein [Anoplolepis gracilipes]|uniref:uncharacterized protein n=1 Tax=Anoplolepis gracilipes TaxID=354296 RepID=UPI003B9EF8E7
MEVLLPIYLKPPTEEDYKNISRGFLEQWNFPNCIGSFDGRHCVIQAPSRSGSLYFNYKKTFSIVLMAACDYNYNFILINVGSYGNHNDASIFSESEIEISLKFSKKANFCFIGDERFPLSKNFLRPYSGRNLDDKKRIFNYRLCARRTIENAFGILVSRWRVLRRPICMHPITVDKIIMSTVCLHNFLKNRDEQLSAVNRVYCLPNYIDSKNDHGQIIGGAWKNNELQQNREIYFYQIMYAEQL